MKKILYSIAVLLTVCAGFTSCIDNFDEDKQYVYPDKAPDFGAWASIDHTGEGFSYNLNITENADGDSIVTVTMFDADGNAFTSTGVITAYDAISGTLVADGYSQLGYALVSALLPAKIYVSHAGTAGKLSVSISLIYNGNVYDAAYQLGAGSFSASPAKHPVSVAGYWTSADGNIGMEFGAFDEEFGAFIGQIMIGNTEDYFTYSYDAASGVVTLKTLTTQKIYTAAYNEKGQLVFDNNGSAVVVDLQVG